MHFIGLSVEYFVSYSSPKWSTDTSFIAYTDMVAIKPGSQYDAHASVASRASGWRWNRLDFYSSVASRALASVQPIRLSKNLTSGMQFDWWKKDFFPWRSHSASVILWTRPKDANMIYIVAHTAGRFDNKSCKHRLLKLIVRNSATIDATKPKLSGMKVGSLQQWIMVITQNSWWIAYGPFLHSQSHIVQVYQTWPTEMLTLRSNLVETWHMYVAQLNQK